MAKLKTSPNDKNVQEFIAAIEDDKRRADCQQIYQWMEEITGSPGQMWGPSIIGFGSYHLRYESGRELDWFFTGFANRKQSLTLYIMPGFGRFDDLMQKLGKHKTGKSCLYIKKLEDVDTDVLKTLIAESVEYLKNKYVKS